jgi:alpha-glucosidase
MLSLYRALIALRRSEPALTIGSYVPCAATEHVLSYERRHADRTIRVALNMMSGQSQGVDLRGRLLISTDLDREGERVEGRRELRPAEGVAVVVY